MVRVPVVHKFGIVSVSRAEQLLREGRGDQNGGKHAARCSDCDAWAWGEGLDARV